MSEPAACARCGHSWAHHRWRPHGTLGQCWDCDCPRYLPSTSEAGGPVLVVTPDQLHEGYVRQRGIGDPGDHHNYAVVRRLDDGNYLVRDLHKIEGA